MDRDESELIARCRKGDVRAFDELVRRYERQIYNFAHKMTGNREDAFDVAQDALVRVFHHIDTFRSQSSFSTWLYRIVLNSYLDSRKRARIREKSISLDQYLSEEEGFGAKQVADQAPAPDETVIEGERNRLLQEAIFSLPDYQRAMIILYHVQHVAYEEIAEILSLPIGTVKSRLNRARAALRKKLEEHWEHFAP
jgi:RNA polymerase sigma-70 factor (ECF subfamily)